MSIGKQIAFLIWEGVGRLALLYMYGCIVFGVSIDLYRWIYYHFIIQ